MATGNVFMNASQKAKAGMEKAAQKSAEKAPEEEKVVNVRVSPDMHKRMMIHRLETGESMNALLLRLLEAELGQD